MGKILALILAGNLFLLGGCFNASEKKSSEAAVSEEMVRTKTGISADIANLTESKNQVSFRRAQDLGWSEASQGLSLFRQDAVHTLSKSLARIQYKSGSEISMKENTFLVIDEPKDDQIDRAVMKNGSIEGVAKKEIWILAASAVIKLKPKKQGEKAQIQIQVKEEKFVNVELKSGEAQVFVPSPAKETAVAVTDSKTEQPPALEARRIELVQDKVIQLESQPAAPKHSDADWLDTVKVLSEAIRPEPEKIETPPSKKPAPPVVKSEVKEVPQKAPETKVAMEVPLEIKIDQPANKIKTPDASIAFIGFATPSGSQLKINGQKCALDAEGRFNCSVNLDPGLNVFVLQLISKDGKSVFEKRMLTRTTGG